LRHAPVQDELKLTKEQREKVKDLMMGMRDKMITLVENGEREKVQALIAEQGKALAKILTAEQNKRLEQVILQVHGLWAMTMADTAKELQLTDEQKKKMGDLQAEAEKEMTKQFAGAAATRTEAQKKLSELHQSANEKGLALLTAEQKAKWKAL